MSKAFMAGVAFWACVAGIVYCLRPKSRVHASTMEEPFDRRKLIVTLVLMLAVILLCTLPMSLSPVWSGSSLGHHDQYEKITEAFLKGHLYFDYDADPRLLEMQNPYDFKARSELEVSCYWDHAFYDGHYYMYFGVVPVFLLFLPFRLLTGLPLPTYHATQVFVAVFICGMFALFYLLCRKFFRSMTFVAYLALSAAFSVMSVWYCTAAPELYCTAISAGLCMEIWSLYCFMRAVWVEENARRSLRWAFCGSLFGALAFGCRPPVALANLLVLSLLAEYLRTPPRKRFRDLVLAAAPYFFIGALLMLYNYLRFDSPFEFGQTYQLTDADQSRYGLTGNGIAPADLFNAVLRALFLPLQISTEFPYITFQSFFGNFPVLLFSFWALLDRKARSALKKLRLLPLYLTAMGTCIVVLIFQLTYAPYFMERYRSDLYWLMAIITFIAFGCLFVTQTTSNASTSGSIAKASCLACLCAMLTAAAALLLFLVPYDYNFAALFPDTLEKIERALTLKPH